MSFYLCNRCFEVYDDTMGSIPKYCPKTDCMGQLFEVDELMLPIIKILNEKGYDTKYCCSGHTYQQNMGSYPYIMFDPLMFRIGETNLFLENCKFSRFKKYFNSIMFPWKIESESVQEDIILRCHIPNNLDIVQRNKFILNVNQSLLEWVNKLPLLENI